jgi:hypothetical protein
MSPKQNGDFLCTVLFCAPPDGTAKFPLAIASVPVVALPDSLATREQAVTDMVSVGKPELVDQRGARTGYTSP